MSKFFKMAQETRTNRQMASTSCPGVDPMNVSNLEPIGLCDVIDPAAFRKECFRVFLNPLGEKQLQSVTW